MTKRIAFLTGTLGMVLATGGLVSQARAQEASKPEAKPAGKAPGKTKVAPWPVNEKAQIEALEKRYVDAFNARNVDKLMECYSHDQNFFAFDIVPPRQFEGWDAYQKAFEGIFADYPGPVSMTMSEVHVTTDGRLAFGRNMQSGYLTTPDGKKFPFAIRVTDGYRKIDGKWYIVLEHVSVPVELATGKADLMSKP
jgi:ketosteroid isomerase-like protein